MVMISKISCISNGVYYDHLSVRPSGLSLWNPWLNFYNTAQKTLPLRGHAHRDRLYGFLLSYCPFSLCTMYLQLDINKVVIACKYYGNVLIECVFTQIRSSVLKFRICVYLDILSHECIQIHSDMFGVHLYYS